MDKNAVSKEKAQMNNGLKPSKVNVTIEAMPYFSASIAGMHISPVTRVVMGTPQAVTQGRLELSVVGRCGDIEFLRRCDFVRDSFMPENYNLKNTNTCALEFDYDCFEYDTAFLNSLEDETEAEIYVLVKFAGSEYVTKTDILLLPYNTWAGLDSEPSVLAYFVHDEDAYIEKICSGVVENEVIDYAANSKKTIMSAVKELYKRLKECNIIYTRPAGYSAHARQKVRLPEELFSGSSILATPLEIALVFSACAKRIGFDTSVLFVRGVEGEMSVLCGVHLVKSRIDVPVCENADKIRAMVDAGDLLIVDPSVFAAAQNTSFVMALENTAESFIQNSAGLVCMIEIDKALMCSGLYVENDEFRGLSVKNSVARIYSSLVSSPSVQFLSGKNRSDIEEIPLLTVDFNAFFNDAEKAYKILPLDFNVNLAEYAAVDKDFSSILTMSSPMAKQHFSNNELVRIKARFERLKERITKEDAVTSSLRDEELYRTASDIAFGKNKKEPYFAFGYVKITDKLTELVSFAPVCLVRADFTYDSGNFYVKQAGNPIVNKVFIRNALKDSSLGYDSFMKSLMPTDKKEIFDMFENIRSALSETDDRHIYEIVREVHIVNVNIDDYVLWSNLALERNKISANETAQRAFSDKAYASEQYNYSYVPTHPLSAAGMKAVCNNGDIVVEGVFTEEKEQVFSSVASRNVTEGKSMLVVTDDMEMSQYISGLLEEAGLMECTFVADEMEIKADRALSRICEGLEKYKDFSAEGAGFVSPELSDTDKVLKEYTERLNTVHKLGMSLKESVSAYLSAGKGVRNCDAIKVDKTVFENISEAELDEIFEGAGELITVARRLQKESGLELYTPLSKHPLYHTCPKNPIDEQSKQNIRRSIEAAVPVLSEYRDVFSDVNEILQIDDREIDSLYKLEKLNDLYKLVLSARDLDIPEKFIESDIADFSKSKRFVAENKKRMEAIEFKLNFFSKEIFEDIETLLVGDEYDEGEKGFLKRFMQKKNSQDVLLQYVEHEKKSEFQQHKVADIYKLLYEYKACVVNMRHAENDGKEADENSIKLARVSDLASGLVDEICAGGEHDKKKCLSNVFRLISVIPVDSHLARKITVARARLAELYSGEKCVCKTLEENLGIDFSNLHFESGILSFDGLGKYFEELSKRLDVAYIWSLWLEKSRKLSNILPGFVDYLVQHGAVGNIDRIFAKSLLLPVSECIRDDMFESFKAENLGKAKERYVPGLLKACEISKRNVIKSYETVVKHVAETNSIDKSSFEGTELREFIEKNAAVVQKVLPIFVVTKNILTEVLPLSVEFDLVALIDNKDNGFGMLPGIAFGKRCALFNMSHISRSSLCQRLCRSASVYNVKSTHSEKDMYLLPYLSSGAFDEELVCTALSEKPSAELVRMNGTFERTTGRTNKTESELSIVKAAEMLSDTSKKVAITAFTKEQCTAIEKLCFVLSRKNKVIGQALRESRLCVCTPDRLYMKKYDGLVVSACFGADKEARIGWDFGYAGVECGEKIPEAYISISDRITEKTVLLTSLNVKDSRAIRLSGTNARVFNNFCEVLSEGRIQANMKNINTSTENSILYDIMAYIVDDTPKVCRCEGKTPLKFALRSLSDTNLYLLCDNDMDVCMHDELMIKKALEEKGKTVSTISPMILVGSECEQTFSGLVKENV